MKSCIGFLFSYLHLTLTNSKGKDHGHSYYECILEMVKDKAQITIAIKHEIVYIYILSWKILKVMHILTVDILKRVIGSVKTTIAIK